MLRHYRVYRYCVAVFELFYYSQGILYLFCQGILYRIVSYSSSVTVASTIHIVFITSEDSSGVTLVLRLSSGRLIQKSSVKLRLTVYQQISWGLLLTMSYTCHVILMSYM